MREYYPYPEAMLDMYDGPDYYNVPIGDVLGLQDYARTTTVSSDSILERRLNLSFGFRDLNNDLWQFNKDTLIGYDMPDFTMPISWRDNIFSSDDQTGGVFFRFREEFENMSTGDTYSVDSTIRFTLDSVESVTVPSPAVGSILSLSFVVLLYRKSKTKKYKSWIVICL